MASGPQYFAGDEINITNSHRVIDPWRMPLGTWGQTELTRTYQRKKFTGFKAGFRPAFPAGPSLHKLAYSHVNVPYTQAGFRIGSQEEQAFRVLHTQNIKPNWNVTIDFARHNNTGFYLRQRSTRSLMRVHTNYRSLNQRYQLYADFFLGNLLNEENGGLAFDTVFTDNVQPNRQVVPINLSLASSNRKDNVLQVRHYLNLGPTVTHPNDTMNLKMVEPRYRIGLVHRMNNQRYRYFDEAPDSSFYGANNFSNTFTNDRQQQFTWENEGVFEKVGQDTSGLALNYSAGLMHQAIVVSEQAWDSSFSNVIGKASFQLANADRWLWNASGEFALSGFNQSDYRIHSQVVYRLNSSLAFMAEAGTSSSQPDFVHLRYMGNHDAWERSFTSVSEFHGKLGIRYESKQSSHQLTAGIDDVTGLIYYDTLALPQQLANSTSIMHVDLNQQWKVLKRFRLSYQIRAQSVSQATFLPLPDFLMKGGMYYERPLFKGNLFAQFGVDANWFSKYDAPVYRPSSGMFHLQNEVSIGNYPTFDFFFNGQIGKVNFFVLLTHLNAGLSGYTYWAAPHVPAPDRAFRLGLQWKFYN